MRDAARTNAAAQWAALFFGAGGLLAITNSLLLASVLSNFRLFLALGIVDLVIAALLWVLPWARWPTYALFGMVPVAFIIIGLFTLAGAHTPATYPIFFILIFIWVGLSFPRWTAVLLTPLTIAAYILPLYFGRYPAQMAASATIAVPVCVLIGEVIAHTIFRLHTAQDVLEQRVAERTVQLQATNTQLQNELAERKQLEAQLLQAQKLEGIGRLAGGIAHDFNNMLMAIGGYADLIAMGLPRDHASRQDVNEIQKSVTRAAALSRQLLTFARKQRIELQVLNPNELLSDLHSPLRRVIGEDIEFMTHPAPQLGWVNVDMGQLTQVILNLVVNARDAMPAGGTLTIETSNLHGEFDAVLITVRDTGVGMDAEVQAHAFEPFFTTKAIGQGTGLGLATCYGIIEQHGGTITLTSAPGQGTTVTIMLPQVETPTGGLASPVLPHAPKRHGNGAGGRR